MFYNLLSAFSIAETAFGTVLSVLCVLKLSLRDVMRTSTYNGISETWMTTLQQRHYARCGITFILAGSILQILLLYISEINKILFLALLLAAVLLPVIISCVFTLKYFKIKKEGWKQFE